MFTKQMALIIVLIVLITLSILLLQLSSRQPYPTHGQGRWAIAVVAPFQNMISSASRSLRDIWEHYFYLINVANENEALRYKAQHIPALEHSYEELRQANDRLRKLLSLSENLAKPSIAAQVVGKDPSPWFQTVLVDKGREDGVEIGHPVIHPLGIVGIVVEVTGHYAKVMLITDPNSAVDALVQKSRARGIIKGGTSGYCVLNYVMRKYDINVGDTIISSGMDGVFPKGMPIGQVAGVEKREAGIFQEVTVAPYVDFERLEEVLIVPIHKSPNPS
ncbi:MAG: rod shape-determining protein MreC [Desulfobacteraceae bacterium]|nr:rod shape-determining protein MreC [Desulfobacteraceae bacterium]